MGIAHLRSRLLIALVFGVVVFAGISAYGDFGKVADGLGAFEWAYLPAILALSFTNYILRFFKWQYYLRLIGVRDFPASDSMLTYLSGLGMSVTPGKLGEWLKCYLVRELHGTPFSRTAPIVIAERLTDLLGLVVLGSVGLFALDGAGVVAVAAFPLTIIAVGFLVALARYEPLARFVLRWFQRAPLVSRFAVQAEQFYESSHVLVGPIALLSMTALSTVSWGFEVLGFFLVLVGSGMDPNADLLLRASFIMPAATLVGATIGMVTPGGLGVAEASLTGLCQAVLDLPQSTAVVATLVIRLGTLWFGVAVGLIALFVISRRLASPDLRRLQDPEPGDGLLGEGDRLAG